MTWLKLLWLTAVCVFVVNGQDQTGDHKFDCRRSGVKCFNENTTCDANTDGLCDCLQLYGGPACEWVIAEETECNQNTICLNNGVCTADGAGVDTCHCTDSFYTSDCSKNRVSYTCEADSMTVTIVPNMGDSAFNGIIYVTKQALDDKCKLEETPAGSGVFEKSILFDDCGSAEDVTDVDGKKGRAFSFMISYENPLITKYDELFSLKCIFPDSDSEVQNKLDVSAQGPKTDPIDRGTKEEDVFPLTIEALFEGNAIDPTASRTIGDEIEIKFTLNGGNVFDSFQVVEIKANNGKEDATDVQTITLVENNCPARAVGYLIKEFSQLEDEQSKSFKFELFQFLDSDKVLFEFTIKFCNQTGACNMTECDPETSVIEPSASFAGGIGRRKRAADEFIEEDGVDFKKYQTTLFVQLPENMRTSTDPVSGVRETSYCSPAVCTEATPCGLIYVIIVVILAIVLLLMTSMCFFFCLRAQYLTRHISKDN